MRSIAPLIGGRWNIITQLAYPPRNLHFRTWKSALDHQFSGVMLLSGRVIFCISLVERGRWISTVPSYQGALPRSLLQHRMTHLSKGGPYRKKHRRFGSSQIFQSFLHKLLLDYLLYIWTNWLVLQQTQNHFSEALCNLEGFPRPCQWTKGFPLWVDFEVWGDWSILLMARSSRRWGTSWVRLPFEFSLNKFQELYGMFPKMVGEIPPNHPMFNRV